MLHFALLFSADPFKGWIKIVRDSVSVAGVVDSRSHVSHKMYGSGL